MVTCSGIVFLSSIAFSSILRRGRGERVSASSGVFFLPGRGLVLSSVVDHDDALAARGTAGSGTVSGARSEAQKTPGLDSRVGPTGR